MGCHNQDAIVVWFNHLKAGMQPTDTLKQYVIRMESIYHCLKDNGTAVQKYHVISALVAGLPAEMESVKASLHGNLAGKAMRRSGEPQCRVSLDRDR